MTVASIKAAVLARIALSLFCGRLFTVEVHAHVAIRNTTVLPAADETIKNVSDVSVAPASIEKTSSLSAAPVFKHGESAYSLDRDANDVTSKTLPNVRRYNPSPRSAVGASPVRRKMEQLAWSDTSVDASVAASPVRREKQQLVSVDASVDASVTQLEESSGPGELVEEHHAKYQHMISVTSPRPFTGLLAFQIMFVIAALVLVLWLDSKQPRWIDRRVPSNATPDMLMDHLERKTYKRNKNNQRNFLDLAADIVDIGPRPLKPDATNPALPKHHASPTEGAKTDGIGFQA